MDLPFDRFLNYVHTTVVESFQEEKDRIRFETRLFRPPPGQEAPASSPWSREQETAALSGLAAAVRGGDA